MLTDWHTRRGIGGAGESLPHFIKERTLQRTRSMRCHAAFPTGCALRFAMLFADLERDELHIILLQAVAVHPASYLHRRLGQHHGTHTYICRCVAVDYAGWLHSAYGIKNQPSESE